MVFCLGQVYNIYLPDPHEYINKQKSMLNTENARSLRRPFISSEIYNCLDQHGDPSWLRGIRVRSAYKGKKFYYTFSFYDLGLGQQGQVTFIVSIIPVWMCSALFPRILNSHKTRWKLVNMKFVPLSGPVNAISQDWKVCLAFDTGTQCFHL